MSRMRMFFRQTDNRAQAVRLQREINRLDHLEAYAGLPGDLGEHGDSDMTIAELGILHEYGSSNGVIPSRPFMRTTASDAQVQSGLASLQERVYGKVVNGTLLADQAMMQIGEWYVGRIKKIIRTHPWTPNAPGTIRAKGSSRPLIDTAQLRNSITYRIRTS